MGEVFHEGFHFVFGTAFRSVTIEFLFDELSSAVTFGEILFFCIFRKLFALLDCLLDMVVKKDIIHGVDFSERRW